MGLIETYSDEWHGWWASLGFGPWPSCLQGKWSSTTELTWLLLELHIPVNQKLDNFKQLDSNSLNTIRTQMQDIKSIFIDEVSMVGASLLNYINFKKYWKVQSPWLAIHNQTSYFRSQLLDENLIFYLWSCLIRIIFLFWNLLRRHIF